jgi:hypothetical protein
MTIVHWIALAACAIAAFVTWSWYSKSRNKGHLLMAISLTVAVLALLGIGVLD